MKNKFIFLLALLLLSSSANSGFNFTKFFSSSLRRNEVRILAIVSLGYLTYKIAKQNALQPVQPDRRDIVEIRAPETRITHVPATVTYVDKDRNTELHLAVRANNAQEVTRLIDHGHQIYNPIVTNLYNETPASIARTLGREQLQVLFAEKAKEFEDNRALITTIANEQLSQLTPELHQHPLIGDLIMEYTFGPKSDSYNLYP